MNTFTISLKPLENHMSDDIYISSALFSRVKCKHEFTLTVGSITKEVKATVFQHRESLLHDVRSSIYRLSLSL